MPRTSWPAQVDTQHAPGLPAPGRVARPVGRPKRPPSPMPRVPALPKRVASLPTGPKLYRETRAGSLPQTGPGLAPPGFVTRQQTASEWVWYWAAMKVLDPEKDPRKPPFWGGRLWAYQSQQLAQIPGVYLKAISTNVDFMFMIGYPYTAVRIQTFRYHEATNALKQSYDYQQLVRLYGQFSVVDVFEEDFLGDPTGRAAIILLKRTLGLERNLSPLVKGTLYPVRNPFSSS